MEVHEPLQFGEDALQQNMPKAPGGQWAIVRAGSCLDSIKGTDGSDLGHGCCSGFNSVRPKDMSKSQSPPGIVTLFGHRVFLQVLPR